MFLDMVENVEMKTVENHPHYPRSVISYNRTKKILQDFFLSQKKRE